MSELRANGLTVTYGNLAAVQAIDLDLEAGVMLAVTGPSGAGKSSLLWALAGALSPAAGSVNVDGTPLDGRDDAAARGVTLIPQGNGLAGARSEERRVGKECRSRWSPYH